MDLGETGRHCPVYATQRMKFLGLEIEELALGVVSFVVLQMLINVFLALLVAFFMVRSVRRMSAGRAPGFLVHSTALWFGRKAKESGAMASAVRGVATAVDDLWSRSGSIPPPTSTDKYRP